MSTPINMAPRFANYMVLNLTTGGRPTVEHASYLEAQEEAARLSRLHIGHVFTVVKAAVSYQSTVNVVTKIV